MELMADQTLKKKKISEFEDNRVETIQNETHREGKNLLTEHQP